MSSDPIVVGTDGSATAELAVDRAAELAQALGAPVHVVTAYSLGSPGAWMGAATGIGIPAPADDENWQQAAQEIVDRTTARLNGQGIDVVSHVCQGEPADVLITIAGEAHAQMIVFGNRGMAGARR